LRNLDNNDSTNLLDFSNYFKSVINKVRSATGAPVILGGSAFSIFPKQLLEILQADYGIIGEGEWLSCLLDALERGQDISQIPGIVLRNNICNDPDPWRGEILREVNKNNGKINYYLKNGGMLNIQTKRGCPLSCIYCNYPLIEGKHMRLFDPEKVSIIARKLQDAGAKFLFITDASFNLDREHSIAVAMAFQKQGLTIPWGAFFTPLPEPRDYYSKLAECGLTHVEFGTDSLSDQVLASYKKPFTVADVFDNHTAACQAGLNVAHYLLLDGPGEDIHSLETSLDNVEKLKKTVLFFFCGIRIYPSTSLYSIALSEGKVQVTNSLLTPIFYFSDSLSSQDICDIVMKRAQGRSNWIIGSGGIKFDEILKRMHKRGYVGPLWERLIH
jgi:radical SAM superfamily enzyme YgiQ (UPF0313 family)